MTKKNMERTFSSYLVATSILKDALIPVYK
jgi:hypothetical protein